ncbi:MAG: DUF4331 domain-containing protein [Actinomycetota bacterium]
MASFNTTKRRVAVTAVAAAAAIGVFVGLGPTPGGASSHREAPLIAADPQADNTDLYAFVSPDAPSTVTIISNFIPFEEPAGGPNFYQFGTGVRYDVRVDNNADAHADLVYRWTFTNHTRNPDTFLYNTGPVTSLDDPDLNMYQTYDVQRIDLTNHTKTTIVHDATAVPSDVGTASMPDYDDLRKEGIVSTGASKYFAGQSDDPFFADLRVFDLLYGGDLSETGDDTLKGFNVNALALQVPKGRLAKSGDAESNPIVGIWSTASRRAPGGNWVQVSRLGNPLVNEVVIPSGKKDAWNASKPSDDGQFLPYVQDPEVARLIQSIYGIPAPATPRSDLVSVFLTGVQGLNKPPHVVPAEELRLNMSIPPCTSGCSTLGVVGGDNAGFPNGRRLSDDVLDVSLQAIEGVLVGQSTGLGDGVDANDEAFGHSFPYVADPHNGSDTSPH